MPSEEDFVVAPFLISQCYNQAASGAASSQVVAPFLISQCYNNIRRIERHDRVVAPFLISQCYNTSMGNPYSIRVSRFILTKKVALK